MATFQYKEFAELPAWVTKPVRVFRPNDAGTWVFAPVPALGDRSVMDLMNSNDDDQKLVRQYLLNVMGKFFD